MGNDVSPQVCLVCGHSSQAMMPSQKGSACHFHQTTSCLYHCVIIPWPTLPPPTPTPAFTTSNPKGILGLGMHSNQAGWGP